MKSQFQPWQFLLLILAGWINRSQQNAVEYLITENRILLNGDQRLPLKTQKFKSECARGTAEPIRVTPPEPVVYCQRIRFSRPATCLVRSGGL